MNGKGLRQTVQEEEPGGCIHSACSQTLILDPSYIEIVQLKEIIVSWYLIQSNLVVLMFLKKSK